MVSFNPILTPRTAPTWKTGFLSRFKIPLTGEVIRSTARIVTFQVLPANPLIPFCMLESRGVIRSFASKRISYFCLAQFARRCSVFWACFSYWETYSEDFFVFCPVLSASSPSFPIFLIRFDSSGSVLSMVSIGISILTVSASAFHSFRPRLQSYHHRRKHKCLHSFWFSIKFIGSYSCFLKDMMQQASFSACLN